MRVTGVTRGTGGTGGDILSHVTRVLRLTGLGVKGSGNMWHRAYRAPGRLPVMVMLIEDQYSPRNIVMRSDRTVVEVDPGDDDAIVAAYRSVSTLPSEAEGASET